ncbi:MAG: hypothetical protein KDI33_17430 [Halioglobus sp.]|nr:hypothetical protein [Halioglobus sp.]
MQTLRSSDFPCDIPRSFDLGFCTIDIVSENIAEIVIKEGVEVTGAMVEQCLGVLRGVLEAPFCLLVNECNSHSYDFRAQTALGATDDLLAVALVSEKPLMDMAACCLMRQPRPTHWPMAVFSNREDALALLNALQGGRKEVSATVAKFPHGVGIF